MRWTRLLAPVIALSLAGTATTVGKASATDEPVSAVRSVLFVGNSYTYYNNLPILFRDLAEAAELAPTVHAEMQTAGGRTLTEAWEDDAVQAALASRPWDAVVLQAQSSFGTSHFVDGHQVVRDSGTFPAAVERFADWAAREGTALLLLAHWPKRDATDPDREMLRSTFCSVADATGARLVRVDRAWTPALYASDGSHPSPAGSYLVALSVLTALGAELPDDLPGTIIGHPVDVVLGLPVTHGRAALVDLEDARRVQLRDAAVAAAAESDCDTLPTAAEPPAPELPDGTAASAAELIGTWRGETSLYPRDMLPSPGAVVLTISERDGGLVATIDIGFEGSTFTESATDLRVTIDDGTMRFTNPDVIEGGDIEYRARLAESGRLDGIAELTGTADPSLSLVGRWHVTRDP